MGSSQELIPHYDSAFIGSGVISILEAIHLAHQGQRVVMIDKGSQIGGVWTPIELFGLTNVENAVHYFLPNPPAFQFMQKALGWQVEISPQKYRIYSRSWLGIRRLPYDSRLGRCLSLWEEYVKSPTGSLSSTFKDCWKSLIEKRAPSTYIRGGTPEIFQSVVRLLAKSKVEIKLSTEIRQIFVDHGQQKVQLTTSQGPISAGKLFITHGSRLQEVHSTKGIHAVEEQHHPRPALHLLIQDNSPADILEAIYVADPLIKYAHDITRFTNEAPTLMGKKKLFVLALQMNCQESPSLIHEVFEKMKQSGVIGKDSVLEASKWWNIHLPTLDDAILAELEQKFSPCICTLKTEDFTAGIAYRAPTWQAEVVRP